MGLLLHHRPPLPLLLALLLAVSCHGTSSDDDNYDRNLCLWQNSTCGNINITYPFYLHNKTAALRGYDNSYCGYPGLRILCEDRKAVLQLDDDNYTVSEINYKNFTISLAVADQEAFDDEGCPRLDYRTTIPPHLWLSYPEATVGYLIFFLCNFTTGNPPITMSPIPCSRYEGIGTSFVFPRDDVPDGDWQKTCQKIKVSVLKYVMSSYQQNHTAWSSGAYDNALRTGFQLVWEPERRETSFCNRCEKSSGRCGYNQMGEFIGCLCSDETVEDQYCSNSSASSTPSPRPRSKKRIKAIAAGAAAGGVALLLVAGSIAYFLFRKRNLKKGVNSSSKLLKYSGSGGTPTTYSRGGDTEYGSVQDPPTHLFSYEELEEATDSFNDNRELGDGGFGIVYKGYLKDGRVVAVKRLYNNSYRRMEQFMNEAEILSRLRHPNLVMFYGCTSSSSRELLLVYEFVANGTVADHLHGHRAGERALSWPLRLNIAVESAAALTYLHAIEQPIVHRDVKTTNILLDADFHVKVADFGLSRLFPLDATHVSTAPQGTPGYVDPEYHQCYQLTDRSDVYSFGVVLVELISSKPAVDITRHRSEINLAGMAINKIQKCQLEELVDLELGYESDPATKKMMTMVAELAFRCLQQNGEMRPPIKEVLEVLRSIQDECRMDKGGDKDKDHGPFSPNTVHAPWDSRATTPNTSRD